MIPFENRSIKDLMGKNIVVFDAEIKNEIDGKIIGWKSFSKMGISVACAFDYRDYRFRVFMDDNIDELTTRLNEPNTLCVAFNQQNFDNNLLREDPAVTIRLKPDTEINNYDMLVESRLATGATQFAKGFKLDDHLKAMGLPAKTADGSLAPIWWKQGKIGKVIDYCLNDVRVEKSLFDRVYTKGHMACAFKPESYLVKDPLSVLMRSES